jgi:LysM repeat protein
MERDALEAAAQLRVLASTGIGVTDLKGLTLDLIYDSAKFEGSRDHVVAVLVLRTSKQNPLSVGQARTLHDTLSQQQHQNDSIGPSGTKYVIKRGDSGWTVAEKFYQQGQYYWIIAGANGLSESQINNLQVGQELQIPPMKTLLWNPQMILVTKGDSIWRVAKERGLAYELLLQKSRSKVRDPNVIYPLQLLPK